MSDTDLGEKMKVLQKKIKDVKLKVQEDFKTLEDLVTELYTMKEPPSENSEPEGDTLNVSAALRGEYI